MVHIMARNVRDIIRIHMLRVIRCLRQHDGGHATSARKRAAATAAAAAQRAPRRNNRDRA
jgi:hypothetical protein